MGGVALRFLGDFEYFLLSFIFLWFVVSFPRCEDVRISNVRYQSAPPQPQSVIMCVYIVTNIYHCGGSLSSCCALSVALNCGNSDCWMCLKRRIFVLLSRCEGGGQTSAEPVLL